MNFLAQLFTHLSRTCGCLVFVSLLLLQACASKSPANPPDIAQTVTKEVIPPVGFFVPAGMFDKALDNPKTSSSAELPNSLLKGTALAQSSSQAAEKPFVPQVWLYDSPATKAYLASGGLDGKLNPGLWEAFLRKYKIPYKRVSSADQLEKSLPGVLLLPSSVALSEAEKQAIVSFRARGGSVLATWLAGVRGEQGQWQGFDFMAKALGVNVLGDTQKDDEDNFMSTYGDNPITHALPAGQRIWLERVQGWYPLRLAGGHPAAEVTDWSRNFTPGKPTTAVVFDEQAMPSGAYSRVVVLGYPERLLLSADPQQLEAVAHNALMWLLRQPDAYLAAWPYPYSSALVMAIDAAEVMLESDLAVTKQLEETGGRGTYFVLSDAAEKSAAILKKMQDRGHEIAYMGDSFIGFRDQSTKVQSKRLDTMRKTLQNAGVELAVDAGFHAPMESYDKTTEKLLVDGAFGYYVAFMDATDTRLPAWFGAGSKSVSDASAKSTLILPRTQSGPDDLMEENDPDDAMKMFLGALALSERMAALSVVRLPNQSLLTPEQLGEVFSYLKARKDKDWIITATHVTQWWRDREQVQVDLEATHGQPMLTVTVNGSKPVTKSMAVWVNLPQADSALKLKALDSALPMPKVVEVDTWRAAVLLDGLRPGRYQWQLDFERHAN